MEDSRKEWLYALLKIVDPVLDALEKGELKKTMPLGFHSNRAVFAPLEAFGRSMLGLAPWLEVEDIETEEAVLQKRYREKALHCIAMASDPDSPDFMNFCQNGQPLVDAAFLAHALVRAPKALAESLSKEIRHNLAKALASSGKIVACNTNWLFFSAMVEGGLYVLGEPYDKMRVIYALRVFRDWYKGDGVYGDGAMFHWDYYNSFVIQPMYVDLVTLFAEEEKEIGRMKPEVLAHAARYASVMERLIAPDGSYPVIGRSVCYRFGAFQILAQAVLQHFLEEDLSPASVRCGLTAVIRRTMSTEHMFDGNGWLLPGVYGNQPELAEDYISVGSLYLCSAVFLPLGLEKGDSFWSGQEEEWSGKKVWSGKHIAIDHAID